MSDALPTDETPQEETVAAEPQDHLADLGLELTDEERQQAEEMVARLRDQFEFEDTTPEPEPEPEEAPDEAPEEEPAQEPEPEPAAPVAQHAPSRDRIEIDGKEYIFIDGQPISVDEIRQSRSLAHERAVAPPAPEPAKPPEWLDMEDPRDQFIWTQLQEQQKALHGIAASQQQMVQEQTQARLTSEVEQGLATFRTNHPELTENDIGALRLHAVGLNIIGGLAQKMPGPDAVLKALDLAYLDHPEFRAKHVGDPSPKEEKAKASQERKQKLGALSGSSGSAPRQETPTRPTTDREMKQQAVQWLSDQNIL